MVYNFPAIIHRIESNLIALDACSLMGLPTIRPNLALEAFTKDSDNSDEHDAEKVNFQGGMGNNYERLEFLGDCFLKMATTISIFTQVLDLNEFHLHCERMALLCNQNLFNNALEVKLEEYVRSMAFNRRTWYPEGLTLKKGKRTEARRRHALGDKAIADVCEALIGAAYLTTYQEGRFDFDMAVQAVTAVVKDEKHAMKKWTQYYEAYQKPGWQTERPNATHLDMARKFYDRLGYKFKYPSLLRSAFHHPSYPTQYENLPSYQRLEFLGDSLFDMVCIDYIFHRYPGADPQWLTEHKMAMVSNQFLGCLAFYLGFHRSILANSPQVLGDIANYAAEMEEALRAAKGEAVREGKDETDFKRNFWVNCSRPPKALPDVVESYIGAIFVDSEYNFGVVQAFFDQHVKPWFEDMRIYDTYANNHPVNQIKEMMQSKFYCSDWRMLTRSTSIVNGNGESVDDILGGSGPRSQKVVCGIMVHGRMLAHAISDSSRYAKPAAAKKAVSILGDLDFDTFRGSYSCDCVVDEDTSHLEEAVGPVI
jgi:endoribonuclease Dicer